MCKDLKTRYADLTLQTKAALKGVAPSDGKSRGQLNEDGSEKGIQFFFVEGAESLGVVDADSVLAREMLGRFEDCAAAGGVGVVTIPQDLNDWRFGNVKSALGALSVRLEWVSTYQQHNHFSTNLLIHFSMHIEWSQMQVCSATSPPSRRPRSERGRGGRRSPSTTQLLPLKTVAQSMLVNGWLALIRVTAAAP